MNAGAVPIIRQALVNDRSLLTNLIRSSPSVHRHLDWRDPVDWIGSPPYFLAEIQGRIIAALACPPDPPSIAWLRLFVNDGTIPTQEAWQLLWHSSADLLERKGPCTSAAIVLQDWLMELLVEAGFSTLQSIVMLERNSNVPAGRTDHQDVVIRLMMVYDLPLIADVDASAFDILWQNGLSILEKAFPQAIFATVAEMQGRLVGYQISTRNQFGIHLARLAVQAELQGKGIGQILVTDLIHRAGERGITRITVNTQSDNASSLALYHRLDFRETGPRYPVYTKTIT
jgi:ribosomal protein S18 acetylase RimI-like enzyme